ncbi:MAG: M48 family metalloprotease [Capsulimonadaceae bacterium]|nr:M48 family metalloprotease [Capsulimonadaceae bacterium]
MSKFRKLSVFGVVAAAAAILLAGSGCKSPSFGNEISQQQVEQIGREEAGQIESQYPVVSTGELDQPVQEIAAKIVPFARKINPDAVYRVKVIESEQVNVFSLPGGWIYVDAGLLTRLGMNTDMVAGVIAHEMAHVVLKHSMRRLSDAYGKAALVDLLTQGGYQEAAGIAIELDLTNHPREEEYDADHLGINLAAEAGYDPAGILKAINTLQTPYPSLQPAEWLGTHPVTPMRLKRIEQTVREFSAGKS